MTCGSITGSALSDSVRLFAMKGIRISAAHRVLMPENYVIFFNVPSEDKLRRRLVKSDRTLAQIIHSIYEKGDTHLPTPLSRLLALPSRAFHGYYLKHRSTAPFHVSNKCIHCGLCAQICPSHAIRMENNRPTWHGACTQCLGCLNRCPIAAINYGRKTQKRGRYVHPDGMGRTSSPGRAN